MRHELQELYTQVVPEYDNAWLEAFSGNGAVPVRREQWDMDLGRPPVGRMVDIEWDRVAADEDYRPPIEALLPDQMLRLWNYGVGPGDLAAKGTTLAAFIEARRRELRELPAVRNCAERRAELMSRAAKAKLRIAEKLD